jgi:hypothetical protein
MKRFLAAAALALAGSACAADQCAPAPVKDAEHAICIASQYAKQSNPWELRFETKEQPKDWLVSYYPKESSVRGGAGDLKIEKASGKVTVVQLYR